MELEELYDRIYRYCYFHTGRILSELKTGHSSDRQADPESAFAALCRWAESGRSW